MKSLLHLEEAKVLAPDLFNFYISSSFIDTAGLDGSPKWCLHRNISFRLFSGVNKMQYTFIRKAMPRIFDAFRNCWTMIIDPCYVDMSNFQCKQNRAEPNTNKAGRQRWWRGRGRRRHLLTSVYMFSFPIYYSLSICFYLYNGLINLYLDLYL